MTNLLLFKINAGWVELNRRPEDGDCALLILATNIKSRGPKRKEAKSKAKSKDKLGVKKSK